MGGEHGVRVGAALGRHAWQHHQQVEPGRGSQRVRPVDEHHPLVGEQDVVGAQIPMGEAVAGGGPGPAGLQFREYVEVTCGPRVEPPGQPFGVTRGQQGPPAAERLGLAVGDGGRLDRGRGQGPVQLADRCQDPVQLRRCPGDAGLTAVDVLEDEGDPGSVVVRPEQPRHGGAGRESGGVPGLGAVQVGAARVRLGADRLDERASAVGKPDPGGDSR